jgi:serine/threonine protein kinase
MGICSLSPRGKRNSDKILSKNSFKMQVVVGHGGFGKVWKVEHRTSKKSYALKELSKYKIYRNRGVSSVINERKILANLDHPRIVKMHYAFQDKEQLYIAMDYLSGGDLRTHLIKHSKFNEQQTKFIVACLLSGLEFIHTKNILHRDIKPENLVFDDKGYLSITDFGISRIWNPKNHNDTSGTPGYMAPEVMMKNDHGIACDLFAVGVIAHECLLGKRPYQGTSKLELREQILNRQAKISDSERPEGVSSEAADFINLLLQRKPSQRLGNDAPGVAKRHKWFKDFDWTGLHIGTLKSPFEGIPLEENVAYIKKSLKHCATEEEIDEKVLLLNNDNFQKCFNDYDFGKKNVNHLSSRTTISSKPTSEFDISIYGFI